MRSVAEIIQRVRPDVLLLNEFDFDAEGVAIDLFQKNFLGESQNGQETIAYPHVYLAESNTGLPSKIDLDGNGSVGGPGDAYGFGFFPGQYGMVLLSRYPIADWQVRTFQHFLWKDMPEALLPDNPDTEAEGDDYSKDALDVFRLSSKSHWDIPLWVDGQLVHVLAAHPTPPVSDGPEDRNGRRNHDEIRFWADYVAGWKKSSYIYDDAGYRGGLPKRSAFVIMGDYNADPYDGDSTQRAIWQLLDHPAIENQFSPGSLGGWQDSLTEGQGNNQHKGNPVLDTGDFNPAGPGNLRVDYVLASKRRLQRGCGGVFWPSEKDQTYSLVGPGFPVVSSDHHLVWQDIKVRRFNW
ncbi:MAG: endonuclease/exonuclease/phosphatase family protein [Endozoicomonas sp.]|uniref:endonuclease/exonuclease/phosphatase family protein n=1 Tax=Endozoicomonas sp. TaxID=1892382 RepID=UPI003D9B39C3